VAYYIRVLGVEAFAVSVDDLREAAQPALIEPSNLQDDWTELVLQHADGDEIAILERNPVVEGELGADELEEFLEEVADLKPASAVAWLQSFLPRVKTIYSFQVLEGTERNDGWQVLHHVHARVWKLAGGIIQSDGEGFTNEQGYTIVWQFSANVSGPWNMGVLNEDGTWTHFEMDLANRKQRAAFREGKIPDGVTLQ
jgi:hypothetical protein